MKTTAVLASLVAVGATVALVDPPVDLQPTIPGVPQAGNLNITGRARAGYYEAYSTVPSGIVYGGDFRTTSTEGRGVLGNASSPTGVSYGGLFQSASSSGRGVAGISGATSGFAVGGFFTSNSTEGKGVLGNSNATSGLNYGVYGKNASIAGFGVYSDGFLGVTTSMGIGLATDVPTTRLDIKDDDIDGSKATLNVVNGAHANFGTVRGAILGEAGGAGAQALGVGGSAHSTTSLSYGVFGEARGATTNYGVYGTASVGTTNYAGYFSGLLYASSSSSGVKAFMIDHPMDPTNKVLSHSSVESDERMDLYRGEIRTDANGVASVTLPTWFDALNEDVLYQLTVIDETDSGGFVMAKVIQRLKNGKFKIRTSSPNTSVSWQVSARRHDPVSNHYPLEVERMKNKDEKGKYYDPEAYGKDRSFGMGSMEIGAEATTPTKRK